jgi:hypothetical protein
MRLVDVERGWRDLLLGREARLLPDTEAARQRVYRRLVRANLAGAVRRAVPITRKLLGDEALDALVERYLDEVGPRTRLVRHVAMEWAEWLLALAAEPGAQLAHPALGELAHWEVLEVDVSLAADADPPEASVEMLTTPADEARIETHPSARLAAYRHPVHTLTAADAAWPAPAGPADEPFILLAWRAQERFVWRRLEGGTAKILVESAQGRTLGEGFAAVESALVAGDSLDRRRVKADLVDLCRRGALLGFSRPRA